MNNRDDGGKAFPGGMSVLALYAGFAMATMNQDVEESYSDMAGRAWDIAEAMVAEKRRREA